jgi:hypothetical protein
MNMGKRVGSVPGRRWTDAELAGASSSGRK